MSPYTVPLWRAPRLAACIKQNCHEPSSRSDGAILGCAPRREEECDEHHLRHDPGIPSCSACMAQQEMHWAALGSMKPGDMPWHLAHIPLLDLGIVFALSKGDMLSESSSCPSGT